MTSDKKRRLTNAVGFLGGVLACLDALHDTRIFWPLSVLWQGLRGPLRLELGGGVALIVVTLTLSLLQRKRA